MASSAGDRRLDLVVYGATSFVGQIVCRHLAARHGAGGDLRWAIAGRSKTKLDEVAAATGADVERIVADATDTAALGDLVAATKVVASTVGPYALYGSELVAAAAGAGTDYCDLTGEPHWMQRMIDAHLDIAAASGARIVHACGFDSIPSDLGVAYTQEQAIERFGRPCERVAMRVFSITGAASGGTVASALNAMEEVARDPQLREVLSNPHALAPREQRSGVRQPNVTVPKLDAASGQWVAPFVMAAVNTRVVHRSHALLGRPWGEGFRYDEAMATGTGPLGAARASAVAAGTAGFMGAAAVAPVRAALKRFVLPAPGEGPSPETQQAGSYDLRFYGTTSDGRTVTTQVTGDRDPGYGSTAKMFGEAATALVALDRDDVGGGFLTPATAFGTALIPALEADAGMTFAVLHP